MAGGVALASRLLGLAAATALVLVAAVLFVVVPFFWLEVASFILRGT